MEKVKRKIAVITVTMNDHYKINEWVRWYDEYKADVDNFIIVDNNSVPEYKKQLHSLFPDAEIIELNYNGGCTGAYNEGIRFALSDPAITHIALIGNDIRLENGALNSCMDLLDSDESLGMVAPVLLEADSDIVADFGCKISKTLSMCLSCTGIPVDKLTETVRYCDAVTGGMNVSKREFYENVGLQDNNLFMYSDEVDMGIRAAKKGYKLAVLRDAKSWHQHISPLMTGRRPPFYQYLIGRNKVYLASKHFGLKRTLSVAIFYIIKCLKMYVIGIMRKDNALITEANWQIIGVIKGLKGNMNPNKYSSL